MSTPNTPTKNTNAWSTKQLVTMALMCAIGVLLSFIEFPLLPGVTWLKFDASNMPAMVSGFAFGPGAGVAVGILTAIIHGLLMADFTGALMNVLKIKSVCFSGRKFRWLWVPERKPLPQTLPEPRAILA